VLLHAILAVIHSIAGAAWLGAMTYSLFVLHPRARAYFAGDAEFEAFIAAVSHGARWKVLLALGLIGLTGVLLMAAQWPRPHLAWWFALVGAKIVLFAAAVGLFVYTSWHLWPARLFAAPREVPRLQRTFRRVGQVMIALAALGMTLGILMHV